MPLFQMLEIPFVTSATFLLPLQLGLDFLLKLKLERIYENKTTLENMIPFIKNFWKEWALNKQF